MEEKGGDREKKEENGEIHLRPSLRALSLSDLRIGKGDFHSKQIFSLRFDGIIDSSERRSYLLRVALRKGLSSNLL